MKMYNNLKYILLLLIVTISSCSEDSLNEISPDSVTMANYWTSEKNAKSAIMEAYQNISMNTWAFGEVEMGPMYYRSDDITMLGGSLQYDYMVALNKFTYSNTNWLIEYYWKKKYVSINITNWVIENIDAIPEKNINEDQRKYIKGEARFLRGVLHMQLLQNFHKIVLKKASARTNNLSEGLSSREEAWSFIIEDFKTASELLPKTWDASNVGRATKNSAFGFLGKAYLYQKNFKNAHEAFIKIEGADLVASEEYENLFNGKNENSIESIFEVQFSTVESSGLSKVHSGASTMATADFDGWDMFSPSEKVMNAFMVEKTTDNKHDIRLLASIAFNDPESTFLGEKINKVLNTPCYKKYIESKEAITSSNSGANFYYMRYADVLLMDAEALAEDNKSSEALPLINKIRKRAGLRDFTSNDKASVIAEIRKQRLLEFCGEGIRFYDLVRWDKAQENLPGFVAPINNYFQVPYKEIQNNPNITE